MGRRSEQRIAISFPVIVSGSDSRGSPFAVNTETYDISLSGASLKSVNSRLEPGMKIEIECRDQKAWFRVQWVGVSGTSKAGRVGVRCLEPRKYIWGVPPKESEPDTYDESKSAAQPATASGSAYGTPGFGNGHERRQFLRHACRVEAHVTTEDGSVGLPTKMTDISLGGCYLETMSPLPIDSQIHLSFNPGAATLHVSGKVRSSQIGFGMGVSFTGMGPEDFEKLRRFAPPTVAPAMPANEPAAWPASQTRAGVARTDSHSSPARDLDTFDLPTSPQALESIIRLLLRKGVIARAELAEELEKLKIVK
jgi:hypothetical protein